MEDYFDKRRSELQDKNAAIAQRVQSVALQREPILNEILEEPTYYNDQESMNLKGMASSIYKFTRDKGNFSFPLGNKLEEIEEIINIHKIRSTALQHQYITKDQDEICKQDYKHKQNILSDRFSQIQNNLNKEQEKEIKRQEILKRNKILLSKDQKAKIVADRKELQLNNFITKMTDKYSQFLPSSKQMNGKDQQQQEIYNQLYEKYKEDKALISDHDKWNEKKEKQKFDTVHKSQNFSKQDSCLHQISHYPLNLELEEKRLLFNQQQEIQEKLNIQKISIGVWVKILKEREKLEFTTLSQKITQILTLIWNDLDRDNSGIISHEQLSIYLTEYSDINRLININFEKLQIQAKKFHTKRKGLLTNTEFIKLMNLKQIKMIEKEIFEEIQQMKEMQDCPLKLSQIFFDHILNDSNQNIICESDIEEKEDSIFEQNVSNLQQLNQLTQINQRYINSNYPPPKIIKMPDMKIEVVINKQVKRNPQFKIFTKDINVLNKKYKNGSLQQITKIN